MESRPESPTINPYAPPKTESKGGVNTRYLEHDGYSSENELISNKHFKSPLICAKLGIPMNGEANPIPVPVTVMRKPTISKMLYSATPLIALVFLCLSSYYAAYEYKAIAIVIVLVIIPITQRLLSKPYKIPFYLSEQYLNLRKRRKKTFSIVAGLLTIGTAYGFAMDQGQVAALCLPGLIITGIIFQFRMSQFIVTKSSDEFHYIRGIHQNLLDALPTLPLANTGQQINLTSEESSENMQHTNNPLLGPIKAMHEKD